MQEKRKAKISSSFSDMASWFMYYFPIINLKFDAQGQITVHTSYRKC